MTVSYKEKVKASVLISYQAEFTGRYKEGLEELAFFWNYEKPDQYPDQLNYADEQYADLLLRSAALYGFLKNHEKEAQEISKDFLTNALEIFGQRDDFTRQASCSNYLAVCYRRIGELEEAKMWVSNAVLLNKEGIPFLHSLIIKSLIDFSEETYQDNFDRLSRNKKKFKNSSNNYYLALFYNHLALTQKNLGLSGVNDNLAKAKELFKSIGNRHLESAAQNNISRYLQAKGEFKEALISSDEALTIAQDCNDLRQQGIILDTIAQIHFDLGNYEESLKYSNQASNVFEKTEAFSYLIEASETKIRALHKLSKFNEALTTYAEALIIARTQTSPKLASNLTAKTADLFKTKPKLFVESEKTPGFPCFDIELPESVRGYDFIAVELTTSRLQDYGMLVGDLIIVKETDSFEDRDLVLVEDFDGQVFIGKAVKNFDCLELHFGDANSTFFEDEYVILGKGVLHLTWSKENDVEINVI